VIPFLKNTTAGGTGLAFELVEEPRSSFAEAFRSLRTSLQFSTAAGVPKVLMVTSASMGEGKSTSALTLAAEKFDLVIIDGPPVLGLADAPLLGNLAEATVMVVEYGATRKGFATDAIKRLRVARTRLLGVVLTKAEANASGYGYYQNYYYYEGAADQGRQRLTA